MSLLRALRLSAGLSIKLIQLDRINVFLQDPATKFHEAATRLYKKIGNEAHDFFATDICYHNFCYIKFALKKIELNGR